jgi:hypothetical protein
MKKISIIIGIICAVIFSGCGSTKHYTMFVEHGKKPIDYTRFNVTTGHISSMEFYKDSYFMFAIERHIIRELSYYAIYMTFTGEGWLRIKGIDLIADTVNKVTLTDNKPTRVGRYKARKKFEDIPNVAVVEELSFELQDNAVQLLKNCTSTFVIAIKGELVEIPIEINKDGINKIKDFFTANPLILDFNMPQETLPRSPQGHHIR